MSLELVTTIKAELEGRHIDLSGPCGAFEITKRVAWAMRAEGAGLLAKPTGNNCDGYAVDIVAFRDGSIIDVLSDAGGTNGPTWGRSDNVDPARWREPMPVDDAPYEPPSLPPSPPLDRDVMLAVLDAAHDVLAALHAQTTATLALVDRIEQLRANGLRVHL